jgi:hypothetical protein
MEDGVEVPLTHERLLEVLDYDPVTGVFTWRVALSSKLRAGAVAGNTHPAGFRRIRIDGRSYKAHRLAWFFVHGRWPVFEIDHRHGVRAGDAIGNLRDVTHAQNQQNQRRARADNKCGLLGACWHKGTSKWRASIRHEGKQKHLGLFTSKEAAHAAYITAKRQLHPFGTI